MSVEEFQMTLSNIERLSPTTLEFRFARDHGKTVRFRPGEFYRFTFSDEDGSFERSYTVANYLSEAGMTPDIDLVISHVAGGRASRWLFNARTGARCTAKGPYGRMVLPDPFPERILMVATSVGVAPFLPMLRQLNSVLESGEVQACLLLGARGPDEFICRDYLLDLRERSPGLDLRVCYSREMPSSPREYEQKGYVQDALDHALQQLNMRPETDLVLLCGNPPMVDDTFSTLREKGFGVRNVIREKYVYARESGAATKQQLTDQQKNLIAEKMKLINSRRDD
jgi:ferredoxin-NADP reductase